ncbi:hypothetical protein GY45DRAFT_1213321, partial [Cubamyces sp. BRFM 1775]
MRIDGSTCAKTHLDDDSGGIVLRRLHPRIAGYNDLVIFLMKCNMDIKFIGSGEAAKALLFYVTDYITKPSLPMHVGLGALSYAVQKTNERLKASDSNPIDVPDPARGALTLTVNRMMSRQEISHQQVMSYLVGGGDVYRSHTFRALHWGSFDCLFKRSFPSDLTQRDAPEAPVSDDQPSVQHEPSDEEEFTLALVPGSISAGNQQQDYIFRSKDASFDSLCLYEFVGTVEKITKRSEGKRVGAWRSEHNVDHPEIDISEVDTESNSGPEYTHTTSGRGRRAQPRGLFSSDQHTQYRTHCLRRRAEWTVPVILGERVPRSDRGDQEKEQWARMMSILFVPWRHPADLRQPGESWSAAFSRNQPLISESNLDIIANMNVLSECRDVRDEHRDMRRAEALAFLRSGLPADSRAEHTGHDNDLQDQDYQLFDKPDLYDTYENVHELASSQMALDVKLGTRSREALDTCYMHHSQVEPRNDIAGGIDQRTVEEEGTLLRHEATMRQLKKQRRPRPSEVDAEERPAKRRRVHEVQENVTVTELSAQRTAGTHHEVTDPETIREIAGQVVDEMHLRQNPEQERAFHIVAEHVAAGGEQLMMYIAGVGGTGKTHVIHAILRLFEVLGR